MSLASAGAVAAGLASLFFIDPAHGGFFPPCPVHWAMGLYCPGCGSLRATHELLHENVLRAAEFNPAFFPALAAVAVICISKRIRVSHAEGVADRSDCLRHPPQRAAVAVSAAGPALTRALSTLVISNRAFINSDSTR